MLNYTLSVEIVTDDVIHINAMGRSSEAGTKAIMKTGSAAKEKYLTDKGGGR
jgi:hypothetical protein